MRLHVHEIPTGCAPDPRVRTVKVETPPTMWDRAIATACRVVVERKAGNVALLVTIFDRSTTP